MTRVDERPAMSLRSSAIVFVVATGAIVVIAIVILLIVDPRTQAFWAARWSDFVDFARGLLPH